MSHHKDYALEESYRVGGKKEKQSTFFWANKFADNDTIDIVFQGGDSMALKWGERRALKPTPSVYKDHHEMY